MRRILKKIFPLLLATFIIVSQSAFSQNFRGVHDMITEDDQNDLFIISSVLQRCSGLYGALAKFLPKSDSQLAALKQNSASLFGVFFERSVEVLNAKKQNTPENNLKTISKSIPAYVDFYYSQLENSQLNTGSIFSPWVKREFDYCNQLKTTLLQ